MQILIIGLGSIARKHITVLKQIQPDVIFYALRSAVNATSEDGIQNIYELTDLKIKPDFVIISNPTINHYETIKSLADWNVPLFIEKPVLHNLQNAEELAAKIKANTYTGFNLRFLDCIQFLKKYLAENKPRINEATIYCGSYLPDWRPGKDFRSIYSANAAMGGGVHLDMIHELDYCYYLFGKPSTTNRFFKNNSSLQIDAIDSAHFVLDYVQFNTTVTLNYFRRDRKRTIEIVSDTSTLSVDLVKNEVKENGVVIFNSSQTIIDTYTQQMIYFLEQLKNNQPMMNNMKEAIEVMKCFY